MPTGRVFIAIAGIAVLMSGAPARAQLSGSVSVESDYRFRGVSLSDGRPDVRLNLSYDSPGGAYAGLSLIGARDAGGRTSVAGYIDYAGYISSPVKGLAWEAGASQVHFRQREAYDYSEVYAGLVGDRFSARLSYSPRYYGRDEATLYADLSTSRRLSPHWRVVAHAGVLTPLNGLYRGERYDVRAGVAVSLRNYEVQLAWTRATPFSGRPGDDSDAVVASASYFF